MLITFTAAELKTYSNLVEKMLSITKDSYGASLAAAQMDHLAFEHTVTITDLRSRIAELQTEICSWVRRSSEDATAAMILAEENVVYLTPTETRCKICKWPRIRIPQRYFWPMP